MRKVWGFVLFWDTLSHFKQKRDFIGPSEHVEIQVEVKIQVWMNPGELTERRASVKALRQVSLHLSALLCSPSFLLGPVP